MKIFFIIILSVAVALADINLFGGLGLSRISLSLSLLILLDLIFLEHYDEAIIWLAASGIVLDIYSSYVFGLNILFLLAIYFLYTQILFKRIKEINFVSVSWLIILGVALYQGVGAIIQGAYSALVISLVMNFFIGTPLFLFVQKIYPREEKIKLR